MTERIWPHNQDLPEYPPATDMRVPRISIIMPSYNQAQFLEAALLSIALQCYPNLELIVLDGGSTDGSVDIIRRFDKWISHWESQKDGGQAAALNKGFAMASGAILGWVNSDDLLLPGALDAVSNALTTDRIPKAILGKALLIDILGIPFYASYGLPPTFGSMLFESSAGFEQPALFWNRAAAEATGSMNTAYPLSFDSEFFLRLAGKAKVKRLNVYLAGFRHHDASITKTLESRRLEEAYQFRCALYGLDRYPAYVRVAKHLYYRVRYFFYAGMFKLRLMSGLETPPMRLAFWRRLPFAGTRGVFLTSDASRPQA